MRHLILPFIDNNLDEAESIGKKIPEISKIQLKLITIYERKENTKEAMIIANRFKSNQKIQEKFKKVRKKIINLQK